MLQVIGDSLHQWEKGRKVKIECEESFSEVHFSHLADSEALIVAASGDTAEIPNILLQKNGYIKAYLVRKEGEVEHTLCSNTFSVYGRPKPADYVYTETEVKNYDVLLKRIEALEKNGTGGSIAVDKELSEESENPVQNKVITKELKRKSNVIINTASGENIIVKDSANERIESMRVCGRSEQFTTSGNQLVKNVTYSEPKNQYYGLVLCNYQVEENQQYTISFKTPNTGLQAYINLNDSYGLTLISPTATNFTLDGKTKTFIVKAKETKEVVNASLIARYSATSEVSTGLVSDFMLNKGTTALPYEPYTGGIASPSPQYPQEIESVGTDGSVDVEFIGKNIADCSNIENGYPNSPVGVDLVFNASAASVTYKNCFKAHKDKQYTVTWKSNTPASDSTRVSVITDDNLKVIQNFNAKVLEQKVTFTANNDGMVHLCLDKNASDIQVEYGGVVTPYEPYNKQSLSFDTPNGLRGIKVDDSTLANYIDSDGNMWCCDEIDLERGKFVKRLWKGKPIRPIVFEKKDNNNRGCCTTNPFGVTFANGEKFSMCSVATWSKWGVGADLTFSVSGTAFYYKDNNKSLEEMNAMFAEIGTNFEVLGILESPIETDLTVEQYKALTMNYPVTTILSDAHIEVDYVADTKNYIDNKFAELATALVAMGD